MPLYSVRVETRSFFHEVVLRNTTAEPRESSISCSFTQEGSRGSAASRSSSGSAPEAPGDLLRCGELTLSESHHEVKYAGKEIELTGREFDLLNTLLVNKNIVLSRDRLLGKVWGYDYMGETNGVDVYIRYLRSKIDEVFGITLIQTVRGVGYVIRDENE